MSRLAVRGTLALLAAIGIACGSGNVGGGSSGAAGSPPPPPVLASIWIDGPSSLNEGDAGDVVCRGVLSDGTATLEVATWSCSAPSIVELATTTGTTVQMRGKSEGTASVQAMVGTLSATLDVEVDWVVPTRPSVVYGLTTTGVVVYGEDGIPRSLWSQTGLGQDGFELDPSGAKLTAIVRAGTAFELYSFTIADGTTELVATFTMDRPKGLVRDSLGNWITQSYGTGDVLRIDAATGASTVIGNNGGGHFSMAIGPGDALYNSPLLVSAGETWIKRGATAWGACPDAFIGSGSANLIIPGGVAFDRNGNGYAVGGMDNRIVRYRDENGDGDALDAGEQSFFATLPFPASTYNVRGISVMKGGGVLVSVDPMSGPTTDAGLWYVADRNEDGDGDDEGEIVKFSSTQVRVSRTADCLAMPNSIP